VVSFDIYIHLKHLPTEAREAMGIFKYDIRYQLEIDITNSQLELPLAPVIGKAGEG
jgi:hypothetical protein